MTEHTTISVSKEIRNYLKLLAAYEDVSIQTFLLKLLLAEIAKRKIPVKGGIAR